MESKEGETAPAVETVAPPAEATPAPASEEKPAGEGEEKPAEKPARVPLTPEEAAKRKAERAERRKDQRKAARQAAKEAKARGEAPAPKPKTAKADKPAKGGDLQVPEGAAPKISVAKVPTDITVADLKALFEPHGTVLRAEVSKRSGRPTIGTIVYNTHADVRRAYNNLHGKHKVSGVDEAISIQYAKDSASLGESLKKATDAVADLIREYEYKPAVLRNKESKDFLNRMLLARKKAPETDVLTAAVLVTAKAATVQELVDCKLIKSAGLVQQILSEKVEAPAAKSQPNERAAKGKKEVATPAIKLEKTFDAVVPRLDKLEKERWNRMAKANLRLNERHRFRFADILATPSLELWRWMVEDCEITPAEAGTCFAILQNYYGFTK